MEGEALAVLPPGVSRRDFNAAVALFRAAVGESWVFTSDEDLNPYRDAYSTAWGRPEERMAGAAVAPANVEQVQAIVRAANRYKVPLFPISTGRNFAYGGPAPNLSGTVVLDLKRLNKVLDIDGDRYSCLVEPGVSYFELYEAIQAKGLKMWIDCPDPGWGSPIGNALDRGIGYTFGPYRDHAGSACGIEVVTGTGDVVRTGMGALPGADSWQDFKYGYGPDISGLFFQANFGIVTKMGFWLYPEPECYRTATVTVPRRADLHNLIRVVNYLEHSHLISEPLFGTPLRGLMRDAGFRAAIVKPDISDAEMDRYASDNNLHSWSVELQFFGPDATVDANWDYAKERFAAEIPGARFIEGRKFRFPMSKADLDARPRQRASLGIPSLEVWSLVTRTSQDPEGTADGHIGFAPIIPRTAEALFKAQRVLTEAFKDINTVFGANAITTPMGWHRRAFIFFTTLPTSKSDPEINRKTTAAVEKLVGIGQANGWGEYRAPPIFQDAVAGAYSFNDNALRRFAETLKDGVDPNGILAPGRGGVWPKRLRGSRA
jgi:4-cresol dehydrogenase (hydroxylating)